MNRNTYKYEHAKDHYDRIPIYVPKGEKERIKQVAAQLGASVSEYLYMLICEDLGSGESRLAKKKQGFTDEQREMLSKWQVPARYQNMIQDMSYSKKDGYFIYLKEGYVNDVTGSRNIYCKTTKEVRLTINKSHKK